MNCVEVTIRRVDEMAPAILRSGGIFAKIAAVDRLTARVEHNFDVGQGDCFNSISNTTLLTNKSLVMANSIKIINAIDNSVALRNDYKLKNI